MNLDGHTSNALIVTLESIAKNNSISLEHFVRCPIEDHYGRIEKSVTKLNSIKNGFGSQKIETALVTLIDRKRQIEEFSDTHGKKDCPSVGWAN